METPVLESLFNKVADLNTCNFDKERLHYKCFPVNIVKFLRTTFHRTPPDDGFCSYAGYIRKN